MHLKKHWLHSAFNLFGFSKHLKQTNQTKKGVLLQRKIKKSHARQLSDNPVSLIETVLAFCVFAVIEFAFFCTIIIDNQIMISKFQIDRLMPDLCLKSVNKSHRNKQQIELLNNKNSNI